jgi:F0F1-type ATP synthase membrane subunit c/vacuolar-type H+-ATPase subunit K
LCAFVRLLPTKLHIYYYLAGLSDFHCDLETMFAEVKVEAAALAGCLLVMALACAAAGGGFAEVIARAAEYMAADDGAWEDLFHLLALLAGLLGCYGACPPASSEEEEHQREKVRVPIFGLCM